MGLLVVTGARPDPVAFLNAWRGDATLCCNLPLAWAAAHGYAPEKPVARPVRLAVGGQVMPAARAVALSLDLPAVDPALAADGDICVYEHPVHGPSLGLVALGRPAFATPGGFTMMPATILAAWGLPCRK